MSAASLDEGAGSGVQAIDALFARASTSDAPTFRVMLGLDAPSVGVHLDAATLRARSDQRSSEGDAEAAARLLTAALAYARRQRLSTSVQLPEVSSRALEATTQQFAAAGFRTELALSDISGEEVALRDVASKLESTRRTEPVSLIQARQRAATRVRLAQQAVMSQFVDRVIVARGDEPAFIDVSTSNEGAAQTLYDATREWSTLRSVRWLSELRSVTARAVSARSVGFDVTQVLDELHTWGLESVVPGLRLPARSEARDAQYQILVDRQRALRAMLHDGPVEDPSIVISPAVTSTARLGR